MSEFKIGDIVKVKACNHGIPSELVSYEGVVLGSWELSGRTIVAFPNYDDKIFTIYTIDLELVESKIVVPKWFDEWYKEQIGENGIGNRILTDNMFTTIDNLSDLYEKCGMHSLKDKYLYINTHKLDLIRIILGDLEYEVEKEIKWTVEVLDDEKDIWRPIYINMSYFGVKYIDFDVTSKGQSYKWDTKEEAEEYIRVNKIQGAEAVAVEV